MPKYKFVFDGESASVGLRRTICSGVYVLFDDKDKNFNRHTISVRRVLSLDDFLPYSPHREEIIKMLREIARPKKILAIKLVRKMTEWGLAESKEWVDNYIHTQPVASDWDF